MEKTVSVKNAEKRLTKLITWEKRLKVIADVMLYAALISCLLAIFAPLINQM